MSLRRAFAPVCLFTLLAGSLLWKPTTVHASPTSYTLDDDGSGLVEEIVSNDPAFASLNPSTIDATDFTIHDCTGGPQSSYSVLSANYVGSTLTLELHEATEPDTGVTCTVDYSGLEDTLGAPVAGSFTAVDGAQPVMLTAKYLDQNHDGVVDELEIMTSEPIDAGSSSCSNGDWTTDTGDFGTFQVACGLLTGTDDTFDLPVSVGGEVRTSSHVMNPSIKFNGGSDVVDLAGNALISSNTVTISDDAPPLVVSTTPSSGSTNASLNTSVVIQFSEPMDQPTTVSGTSLTAVPGGPVTFGSSWNTAGDQLTLTPTAPLGHNTAYDLAFSSAVASVTRSKESFTQGVALDGVPGTYIDVPYGFDPSTNNWTFMGISRAVRLIKKIDDAYNDTVFLSQQNGTGTGRSISDVEIEFGNVLLGTTKYGSFLSGNQTDSTYDVRTDDWLYWAETYNATTHVLNFYAQGQPAGTFTCDVGTCLPEAANGNFRLGSQKGGMVNNLAGNYVQFVAYKSIISPSDIANWYTNGAIPSAAKEVEYLFADGSGTTVSDSSGNGRNGSFVGGVSWTGPIIDGHEDEAITPSTISFRTTAAGSATVNQTTPAEPIAGQPLARSADTIRWYFTDQATNETGFRIVTKDASGKEQAVADSGPNVATNLSYLDETGLTASTEYCGRFVEAYNGVGTSDPVALPCVQTLAVGETPVGDQPRLEMTQTVTRLATAGPISVQIFSLAVPIGAFWGVAGLGELRLVRKTRRQKGKKKPLKSRHAHRLSHLLVGSLFGLTALALLSSVGVRSVLSANDSTAGLDGVIHLHPHDRLRFTFNVFNGGTGTASAVQFADGLPFALTPDLNTLTATVDGKDVPVNGDRSNLQATLGDLAPSATAVVSYEASVGPIGSFDHAATLTDASGTTTASNPVSFSVSLLASQTPRFQPLTLLRTSSSTTVYLIDENGQRRPFLRGATYFTWFSSFRPVRLIPDDQMQQIVLGPPIGVRPGTALVKMPTSPVVYAVEPGNILQPIASEAQAKQLYGPSWAKQILDIDLNDFDRYRVRTVLQDGQHPDGELVTDGSTLCYVKWNACRPVTANGFTANKLLPTFIRSISSEALEKLPVAAPLTEAEVNVELD